MIYFLAAIVPLSGACKGCAGAHVGANAISSGGSEIRRAPLSKHSGTDQPWAGSGSTMPGHSLPSKGNDEALWTPGAEAGSREGGSGPQPGCSASLKPPWDPAVSPLRRGHYPVQLPGAQVTRPQRSPTKGLRVDPQAPLSWEETASSTLWNRPRPGLP